MSPTEPKPDADWERHRAFLAVIRNGSLSAASRALNIAQPTVRRRIEDLELLHGVVLFTRSPAGLLPTVIAHELAAHVETMARAADAFTRAASAEAGSAAGTVRIAASEVVGVEVLPPMLASLRAQHSGLVIDLGLSNRSENLLGREADIAVRMVRPVQDALLAKRVGTVRLGLYAHRRFIDAHGLPGTIAELKGLAMIGFESETLGVRTLRASGMDFQREDFVFRTDSDLAQLAAIRAGVGIGVCQVGIAQRDPDLIAILADAFDMAFETWVVTHEDLRHVLRVRLAYDALVEGLTEYAA